MEENGAAIALAHAQCLPYAQRRLKRPSRRTIAQLNFYGGIATNKQKERMKRTLSILAVIAFVTVAALSFAPKSAPYTNAKLSQLITTSAHTYPQVASAGRVYVVEQVFSDDRAAIKYAAKIISEQE